MRQPTKNSQLNIAPCPGYTNDEKGLLEWRCVIACPTASDFFCPTSTCPCGAGCGQGPSDSFGCSTPRCKCNKMGQFGIHRVCIDFCVKLNGEHEIGARWPQHQRQTTTTTTTKHHTHTHTRAYKNSGRCCFMHSMVCSRVELVKCSKSALFDMTRARA